MNVNTAQAQVSQGDDDYATDEIWLTPIMNEDDEVVKTNNSQLPVFVGAPLPYEPDVMLYVDDDKQADAL